MISAKTPAISAKAEGPAVRKNIISIAPMMDYTDRHFRYLARLISAQVLLYSEMVTADAILRGKQQKLLGFNIEELPLVLQLGGSDPEKLKQAAKIGEHYGYSEINLNVGCPSDRVQSGRFGACLMKEPELVADCVAAMREAVSIPVTVKTRTGVDDLDSYDYLCQFIEKLKAVGCQHFIIHARKAWLKGLSPRENREIPPLNYQTVYQLKRDFPELEIALNGGVTTAVEVLDHLQQVDSVMIGRAAYANPMLLVEIEQALVKNNQEAGFYALKAKNTVKAYMVYIERELSRGERLRSLIKPLLGMFQGQTGARQWRRHLSENAGKSDIRVVEEALEKL